MVWDGSFESWDALGIAGQPATIVFGADGEQVAASYGLFDAEEVLSALDST